MNASPGQSPVLPEPLRGRPRYLFLEITSECGLRCKMCHLWMTHEPAGTLTTDEKLNLVRQFGEFGERGVVVLTGGEPFRKPQEVMALSRAARVSGLSVAVNTAGTSIEPEQYEEILSAGPHYLVISLDAPRAEVHDWMRGCTGTFERAQSLIRDLARVRRQRLPQSDVKLLVNAILCRRTLPLALEHVEFVRRLGADGIMFQALARTFMNRIDGDPFFASQRPVDLDEVNRVIDALVDLRQSERFVCSEGRDLQWMKPYFRNPDFIGEPVCGSAHRNLMINMFGEIQLCFAMKDLLGGRCLGNVRDFSLRDVWLGAQAAEARRVMDACRRNCGMLHCHRREGP